MSSSVLNGSALRSWAPCGADADSQRGLESCISRLMRRVEGLGCETRLGDEYRAGFRELSAHLEMYPPSGERPSLIFETLTRSSRRVGAVCLPLGIALAMHLYPVCALHCAPLPRWSLARLQRALLLGRIRKHALILANAGSDRSEGSQQPILATRVEEGILLQGCYDYMSLASVADIVLMKARFADGREVLCAADLCGETVKRGTWKFKDRMRLSDTRSITFENHLVPNDRYLLLSDAQSVDCLSSYQRCWFHLFIADVHLARLDRLHSVHGLPLDAEHIVSRNEVEHLRAHCLHMLDDCAEHNACARLFAATSSLKLRVSLLCQVAMKALQARCEAHSDTDQIRMDAAELGFIRSQPTADKKILQMLGVVDA